MVREQLQNLFTLSSLPTPRPRTRSTLLFSAINMDEFEKN